MRITFFWGSFDGCLFHKLLEAAVKTQSNRHKKYDSHMINRLEILKYIFLTLAPLPPRAPPALITYVKLQVQCHGKAVQCLPQVCIWWAAYTVKQLTRGPSFFC